MNHPSSLTSLVLNLFRFSLLYVALLSTFYLHFSFSLLLFSVLFLIFNIILIYKKMSSHERLVQAKKQLEKEVIKQNGLQNEDRADKVLDESQLFEPDFMHRIDYGFDKFKSDSDIFLSLDSMSEDVEEDYDLIEIELPEAEDEKKGNDKLKKELLDLLLQEEGVEDLLVTDVNEISGEDNLIEIDISLGSIR